MNSPALIGRPWPGNGSTPLPSMAGLTDRVLVAQRVEVARLGAEVLRHQHGDAGEAPRYCCRAVSMVRRHVSSRVAEDADRRCGSPRSRTAGPSSSDRSVRSPQELSARAAIPTRNASGKLCERVLRHAQRHQPGIADRDRDPGLAGLPPLGGGIDVRRQPPQELATGPRIVHVEHDVRAVVRLGPIAQHRRLDVVELHGDGPRGSSPPRRSMSGMVLSSRERDEPSSPGQPARPSRSTGCPGGGASRRPCPGTRPPPGRRASAAGSPPPSDRDWRRTSLRR